MVPNTFKSHGWEFLCERLGTCPDVFVQEFTLIYITNTSVPMFVTYVRGIGITVTLKLISDVL